MGDLTFEQRPKGVQNKQISREWCSFMAEGKRKGTGVRAGLAYGRDSREARRKEKGKGQGSNRKTLEIKNWVFDFKLYTILLRLVRLSVCSKKKKGMKTKIVHQLIASISAEITADNNWRVKKTTSGYTVIKDKLCVFLLLWEYVQTKGL